MVKKKILQQLVWRNAASLIGLLKNQLKEYMCECLYSSLHVAPWLHVIAWFLVKETDSLILFDTDREAPRILVVYK